MVSPAGCFIMVMNEVMTSKSIAGSARPGVPKIRYCEQAEQSNSVEILLFFFVFIFLLLLILLAKDFLEKSFFLRLGLYFPDIDRVVNRRL
jgi:hypothetical protein